MRYQMVMGGLSFKPPVDSWVGRNAALQLASMLATAASIRHCNG